MQNGAGDPPQAATSLPPAPSSPPLDEPLPPLRVRDFREMFSEVRCDYRNFYTPTSLGQLLIGIDVAAIAANTPIDRRLRDTYQENVHSDRTDEISHGLRATKFLGDGYSTLPVYGIAAVVGVAFEDHAATAAVGDWGSRSLRTIAVGAPPLLVGQVAIGAGRPSDSNADSAWRPFLHSDGISGHAFMGAVPFISAAKMTDNWPLKAGFYAGSTLTGLSRINDDAHYSSQVLLGWWLAYLSATAVDHTKLGKNLSIVPLSAPATSGVGIERRW